MGTVQKDKSKKGLIPNEPSSMNAQGVFSVTNKRQSDDNMKKRGIIRVVVFIVGHNKRQ